ncbi:DNA adenine methylase [Phaeocystidibacter luteus]|uniref:DNA adenine methylase n=1 Tax=Phaeocystidibacter luteus TaxID=911197 RepID=UPI001478B7D7|nr:DNA adenine methylase [Phaeocystidibacter luteus]
MVRYFGGKWRLADRIIECFPKHHVYVEPFGGAASVLLRKEPAVVEVYNDLNDDIVNLFQVLRDPYKCVKLQDLLRLTPYAREEWSRSFESKDNISDVEHARRTIVTYSMSYSGARANKKSSAAFRTNSSGHNRLADLFQNHIEDFTGFCNRLKGVIIEKSDYQKVCMAHDSTRTLIYFDPPYPKTTRTKATGRYKYELLSIDEHRELFEFANGLKSMVIVSSYDSPEYREWYGAAGWEMKSFKAVSNAAKKGACLRDEVIWINPHAQRMNAQLKLFES